MIGNDAFLAVFGGGVSTGGGIQIIDVSEPQLPRRIGGVTKGDTYDLEVVGSYAYAAHFGGLRIVNIENPEVPLLAGSLGDTGAIWDVDTAGNHAFLANIYEGLRVVDISNPSQPKLTSTLATKAGPTSVRVVRDRVFLTDYDGGVEVVDVSDPAQPVLVGSIELGGSSREIAVADSYAYVANSADGLVVLKMTENLLGFSRQPGDVQVETGQTAVFTAAAVSMSPFTFQWQKDGINLRDDGRISGSTTASLSIANAMTGDQACFRVVVSNAFGSVASSNACLSVVPGLREALDDTNLVWTTTGPGAWKLQTEVTHDSVDAAVGGPLQAGIIAEANRLDTIVEGPGQLSFWWKLEDTDCFVINLVVGTNRFASIPRLNFSSTNWEHQVVTIPPGTQKPQWILYTLCGCGSPPGRAWLDEVSYSPDAARLAIALAPPGSGSDSLIIEVTGRPGTAVRVERSTDLVTWAPLSPETVSLPDGKAVCPMPIGAPAAFYRAVTIP